MTILDHIRERRPGRSGIEAAARRWVVLLSSETVAGRDRAAFEAWVAADPRHGPAYDELERVWLGAEQLTHLRDYARPEDLERFAVGRGGGWMRRLGEILGRPSALAGALATAAVAVLLAIVLTGPVDVVAPPAGGYVTETAEIRDITLADGSEVTLGARSRIDVDFSASERRVTLTSGEAFFSVTSDPARPFFVVADQAVVRVVGTRFEVRRAADRVRVAVAEGIVEITVEETPADAPLAPAATVLSAGQQLVAVRDRPVEPVRAIDSTTPGAWREGRLYYEDASLIEVISDANRYYEGQIRLATDAIGDLSITGSFRTDRIESMLATLEQILPVEAERDQAGRVLLKARPEQG